jgi:uncharacterized heparinase superfamily protein
MSGPRTFDLLNQVHTLDTAGDWNNSGWSDLWLYNLHYFDDLNAAGAPLRRKWHLDLIARWVAENPPLHGIGWDPYPTSVRIVNWVKWALVGARLPEAAVHSLAVQARFLVRNLEIHLQGNHLVANAKALIYAGAFFEGDEARQWLAVGLDLLDKQIREQILEDGGHFELSPMYHSVVLEDILDLCNLFRTYPTAFRGRERLWERWGRVVQRMSRWLKVMCHPDGEIALFNDAALHTAAHPTALETYAGRLGLKTAEGPDEGVTELADSGYLRVQRNELLAILDVGPIGPDYLPGHAHADTLSFELSLRDNRVMVDTGTSTYANDERRRFQRSTGAHNTVVVDDQNSSEVWGQFRVARRAYPLDLRIDHGERLTITCGHDGYHRLPGKVTHERSWVFGERTMHVKDTLTGSFSTGVAHFHLHPKVRLVRAPDGDALHLSCGDVNARWTSLNTGVGVGEGTYHPSFGVSMDNLHLTTEMDGGRGSPVSCCNCLTWGVR